MVPFVPILDKEEGGEPFAIFQNLWIKCRTWMLEPIRYSSVERLVEALDLEIITPTQARFAKLLAMKAEEMKIKDV